MDYLQSSTWITIGLILGSILISGPLIPAIDIASEPIESTDSSTAGEASLSIESPPEGEFRIASGRFGSGPVLYVPPVTVRINSVRGDPILIYEVAIQGLGFNVGELVFLSASDAGRIKTIEIDRPPIDQDTITEQTYGANVSIRLRAQSETRVLYRNNVTVIVVDSDGN